MARVIALDSGPLGMASHAPGNLDADAFRYWMFEAWSNGALIIVPEIVDYEVRRSLILAELWDAIKRLDNLYTSPLQYLPITTAAMRQAAYLWAKARREHRPTAGVKAIDGDVIVAAQALAYVGLKDELIMVTDNLSHLNRYVGDRARRWQDINP